MTTTVVSTCRPALAVLAARILVGSPVGPSSAADAADDAPLLWIEGEMCLVVGLMGVGKSILLGAINGHVPHVTGGTASRSPRC